MIFVGILRESGFLKLLLHGSAVHSLHEFGNIFLLENVKFLAFRRLVEVGETVAEYAGVGFCQIEIGMTLSVCRFLNNIGEVRFIKRFDILCLRVLAAEEHQVRQGPVKLSVKVKGIRLLGNDRGR